MHNQDSRITASAPWSIVMAVLFGSIGLAIVTVRPFVKAKNKFKVYEYQVEVTD